MALRRLPTARRESVMYFTNRTVAAAARDGRRERLFTIPGMSRASHSGVPRPRAAACMRGLDRAGCIAAKPIPAPESDVAAFLSNLMATGDAGALLDALGEIARRRGMTRVARDAGLTREALYRALRADAYPRFDTIVRVCAALGVKLTLEPVRDACCDDAALGQEPR